MGAHTESRGKHPVSLVLGTRSDESGQMRAPVALALSKKAEPRVHVDVVEEEKITCSRRESSPGSQICHLIS